MSRRLTTTIAAAAAAALTLGLAPAASAAPAVDDRRPATIPLPDRSSPEGIAGGPGSTFFAGSRADGSIVKGSLRTGTSRELVAGVDGRVAVGMQYDPLRDRLWVAGGDTGTVTAYDATTGEQVVRYRLGGTRFLNDVDVSGRGVFVTDSLNAELVVVRGGRNRTPNLPASPTRLPLTGDWDQSADDLNANGVRALPKGDLLVVDQGELLRVDPRSGRADLLRQTGGRDLTAGDGLELRGRTLFAVYGFGTYSVAKIRLGEKSRTYRVTGNLQNPRLDRPTTATRDGNALYAVNGKFDTVPAPREYEVVRVPIR